MSGEVVPRFVRIAHRLMRANGQANLFCEIRDVSTGEELVRLGSTRWAALWLQARGFSYVAGTAGVWGRTA